VGLVQPLVVRPADDGYEIVVGERRYRACQQAGLDKVPVIIKEYTDDEVIELNLIENVHRENLSAVEKGNCCKQLLEKYPEKYPSLAKLAEKLGLSQSTITEWLTLIVRKVKEPEKQVALTRKVAEKRIPQAKVRTILKEIEKEPEKPIEEVVKKVVEAPYELPFRLGHMEPILKGIKTQTSRRGIPDPRVKEGAIVHAAVWEPHFADLRIEKIERKKLGDFTEEDAQREGGYTLEEFREVWRNLHGDWNPNENVYVIHFRLEEKIS